MKLSKLIFIAMLAILLSSCAGADGSDGKDASVCVDQETGIEMSQEACDALNQERAKRKEAEAKATAGAAETSGISETSGTGQSGVSATVVQTTPAANTVSAADAGTKDAGTESPSDVFEDKDNGFKLRIPSPRHSVYKLDVPSSPTQFTDQVDTAALFGISIGNPGPGFLVTVENYNGKLREDGVTPTAIPSEGGLSEDFVQMASDRNGYFYTGNALGFYFDPHVTVFAGKRIYYIRKVNSTAELSTNETRGPSSISPELRDFARGFEVLQ